jgi:hypothetical protein
MGHCINHPANTNLITKTNLIYGRNTKTITQMDTDVSGFFALLEIMVSFALSFSPQSVLETVDLNAKGVDYLIYMWAARQFALGFIFGFATFKRSVPMLTIAYIFFL